MTRKRWQELAIVLLILAPLMALIWLPILTSDTKPWEAGDPIPDEPPDEEFTMNQGFRLSRRRIGRPEIMPE